MPKIVNGVIVSDNAPAASSRDSKTAGACCGGGNAMADSKSSNAANGDCCGKLNEDGQCCNNNEAADQMDANANDSDSVALLSPEGTSNPAAAPGKCCNNKNKSCGQTDAKSIAAARLEAKQQQRSSAATSSSFVGVPSAPPCNCCQEGSAADCCHGVKSVVLYRADMCGFRVPAALLIAICVVIGVFGGPSYGFVAAFIFLVIAACSRARATSGSTTSNSTAGRAGGGAWKRNQNGRPGSNIRGVKDLPPLPRKGGG
jgi:hypothetical protein